MPPLSKNQKTCLAMAIAQSLGACDVNAATINVTPGCTLVQAIQTANGSVQGACTPGNSSGTDTIVLPANSIFYYTSGFLNSENGSSTATPLVASNITIEGNNSTVTRATTSTFDFRLFAIFGSGKLTINNLIISNGDLPFNGGGIYVSDSGSLELNNSKVLSNAGRSGGGIFSGGGNVILNDSQVSNNRASGAGGGMLCTNGATSTLKNTMVSGNSANSGGGIFNPGRTFRKPANTMNLIDSTVSDNSAGGLGGGIFNSDRLILNRSTISKNLGGGIYNEGGTVNLTNTSVIENYENGGVRSYFGRVFLTNSIVAGNSGRFIGGIDGSYTTIKLTNSTVSGNSSGSAGGGIKADYSFLELTNTTISGNSASSFGGGIAMFRHGVRISNTIISGNYGNKGAEIFSSLGYSGTSGFNFKGNNMFGDDRHTNAEAFVGDFIPPAQAITATSDGNTPTDLTSMLLPLANNGGRTLTHALVENSPAIDSGGQSICNSSLISSLDQRRFARDSMCDLGAFEFNSLGPPPLPPPSPPFKPATIIPPIILLLDEDS